MIHLSFSPFTGALRTGGADGPGAAVVAQGFLDTVGPLPSGLPAANETALSAAATLMITAIRTDGVVQGVRRGPLGGGRDGDRGPGRRVVPTNRLALRDIVVLDNGAPYGDAVLPLPDGGAVCAVSSITSALLMQLLVAEMTRQLLAGGDVHNRALEERYAGRIRRTAG